MKRTKHTKQKRATKTSKRHLFIGGCLIIFLVFIITAILLHQLKAVVETPRSEMKKLPLDVKKSLAKASSTASISATMTIGVPILMYHYVEYVQDKKDTMRQALNIIPSVFEEQIQTLVNAKYTFLTAKELGDVLDRKMQLPHNPILLTFDDGHWDFDTVVLPILKKYQVKATAYIIPGFTGGSDFMSHDQMQDVINSHLVDIGAHTVHHISLKGALLPIVQYEITQSKIMLEQTYHIHVVSFAYPNGAFDGQAIDVVKNAGFTTGTSTIPGIQQNQQNRFFLYRLRPGYRTGQQLIEYLQQDAFKEY